jgi:branched-chain amino acid transport system ATP-binding protein
VATSALAIENVKLDFYGAQVLRGVDFAVREGSFTGLIGPNGAGKSTLFNAVSGLYRPKSGTVRLYSADVTGQPPDRLVAAGLAPDRLVAAGLVRSFQLARGFPKLSVFQHFMLYGASQPGEGLLAALVGSRDARRREHELAEKAHAIIRRMGLERVVDNPVTALSGGQKKLVEIGRALMAEPKVLLLDEPMAGVNPTLAQEIAERFVALNREGMTICLIEHEMGLIRQLCDNVVVMAEGRVLTQGSFDEVTSDTRVQEAYLGRRH